MNKKIFVGVFSLGIVGSVMALLNPPVNTGGTGGGGGSVNSTNAQYLGGVPAANYALKTDAQAKADAAQAAAIADADSKTNRYALRYNGVVTNLQLHTTGGDSGLSVWANYQAGVGDSPLFDVDVDVDTIQFVQTGGNGADRSYNFDGTVSTHTLLITSNIMSQSGTFIGNAAGLTNLNSASIAGTLPTSTIQGQRTNIQVWSEDFSGTLSGWQPQSYLGTNADWKIVSGKLQAAFPTGGSIFGEFLCYTNGFPVTAFESWSLKFQLTPKTIDATSYGLAFGIRSALISSDRNLFGQIWLNSANNGNLMFLTGSSNAPANAGFATNNTWLPAVSVDEPIDVTLRRRGEIWTIIASNTVTGIARKFSQSMNFGLVNYYGQSPQAGYVTFWERGGTQTVDNVSFTLEPIWPVTYLVLGDSIAEGYNADLMNFTWFNQVRKQLGMGVQRSYAPGGTLNSVGLSTNEINLLQPHNVINALGGNDVARGDAFATWTTNYIVMVNCITNTTMWHLSPTARTNVDLSGMFLFQESTYPLDRVIDVFDVTKATNSSWALRSDLNSGDGIHPNAKGHALVAEHILNALTQ